MGQPTKKSRREPVLSSRLNQQVTSGVCVGEEWEWEWGGVVVVVGGGWWWCGQCVHGKSLSINHDDATDSGGRTPGSQTPGVPATPEPSMTKNSSPSRAPKTGAQLQTTWRSAKNGKKSLKSPHRRQTQEKRTRLSCELEGPLTPAIN